nr:MAG TPA: hypothetical protein [Caudoviricetes sp.]
MTKSTISSCYSSTKNESFKAIQNLLTVSTIF